MPELQISSRLREIARSEDVVWFVGSGVSTWSGLPRWDGLIEQLATMLDDLGRPMPLVRTEAGRGDLLTAASYGFDALSPSERAQFIQKVCLHGHSTPSELHHEIAKSPSGCFVTTNYDQLLEQALGAPTVVTSRHQVELATIVQARSRNFVFKPHGDVGDIETVVLTREHYRDMLGENRHVTDAVRTLLVSRPVIYIGFGLRDPDFMALLDTLATTRRTPLQDHFALMADVSESERDYWRRSTGINIVTFATVDGGRPSERFANLLMLVKELHADELTEGDSAESSVGPHAALDVLRYLGGLAAVSQAGRFSLTHSVRTERSQRPGVALRGYLHEALAGVDSDILLTGPPGAGKSVAIDMALSKIATDSFATLLEGTHSRVRVPLRSSLRHYSGALRDTIEASLPSNVVLADLVRDYDVVFFIDGLNEVADEYVSTGHFARDLSELREAYADAVFVLATRFGEAWSSLKIPEVTIERVPESTVERLVSAAGVSIAELDPPVFELLSRPLFLSLLRSGELDLSAVQGIHDIYRMLVRGWTYRVSDELGVTVDVGAALSRLAYEVAGKGRQLLEVSDVERSLSSGFGDVGVGRIISSLLKQNILFAEAGSRVAFMHHSILEYLAASHLSTLFVDESESLDQHLEQRSWDHVILLCLGYLDEAAASDFYSRVVEVDVLLALRALWYVESDQERLAKIALRELFAQVKSGRYGMRVIHMDLPPGVNVVDELRELSALGGFVGAYADFRLLMGRSDTADALGAAVIARAGEYTYLSELGRRFGGVLSLDDVVAILDKVQAHFPELDERLLDHEDNPQDLAMEPLFEELLREHLRQNTLRVVEELDRRGPLAAASLIRAAGSTRTTECLVYLMDKCLEAESAVFWTFLALRHPDGSGAFAPGVLARVVPLAEHELRGLVAGGRNGLRWRLDLLKTLCGMSEAVPRLIHDQLPEFAGILGVTMAEVVGDRDRVFRLLADLAASGGWGEDEREWDGLGFLDELDWSDHIDLLRSILTSNATTAFLAEFAEPLRHTYVEDASGQWRVSWTADDIATLSGRIVNADAYWHGYVLGSVLGGRASSTARHRILEHFRVLEGHEKTQFYIFVLSNVESFSLDDFRPSDVDWMIEQIVEPHFDPWDPPLLVNIATAELVEQQIIPRIRSSIEFSQSVHAQDLLDALGKALGARFFL